MTKEWTNLTIVEEAELRAGGGHAVVIGQQLKTDLAQARAERDEALRWADDRDILKDEKCAAEAKVAALTAALWEAYNTLYGAVRGESILRALLSAAPVTPSATEGANEGGANA